MSDWQLIINRMGDGLTGHMNVTLRGPLGEKLGPTIYNAKFRGAKFRGQYI